MKFKLSQAFYAFLSIMLLSSLVSCGLLDGPKEALEQQIVSLALPDSAISEDEWNSLTVYVKEYKQALTNDKVDCFTDSTLRMFAITALQQRHPGVEFKVWRKPLVKIERVKFFMETSASMKGYFKPISSQFKKNVNNLLTDPSLMDGLDLEIYTLSDAKNPAQQLDLEKFTENLALMNIPTERSSELRQIFTTISGLTGENEVSFFVSDGIMSVSSDIISKDIDANLLMVENLKNGMRTTFNNLRKDGFGVVMYAFTSEFQGTYYTYQNKRHELSGVSKPYYMWCIGSRDAVQIIDRALSKNRDFNPEQRLEMGLYEEFESEVTVLNNLRKQGKWSTRGADLYDLKWQSPTRFTIGLDLSGLPEYAKGASYLEKNLKVAENHGIVLKLEEVLLRSDLKQSDQAELTPNEKVVAQTQLTHFLVFTVPEMVLPSGKVKWELVRDSEDWVSKWSIPDDRERANAQLPQTWELERLVEGMKEGYNLQDQRYMAFTLNFNQQK